MTYVLILRSVVIVSNKGGRGLLLGGNLGLTDVTELGSIRRSCERPAETSAGGL